jgi:hypothetical protein
VALGVVWALVIGPPPLPDRIELPVGMIFQAIAYGVCIVTAVVAASRREVRETVPMWNRQVVPQRVG